MLKSFDATDNRFEVIFDRHQYFKILVGWSELATYFNGQDVSVIVTETRFLDGHR